MTTAATDMHSDLPESVHTKDQTQNHDSGHAKQPSKVDSKPPPCLNTIPEEILTLILKEAGIPDALRVMQPGFPFCSPGPYTLDHCIQTLVACCLVSQKFCRIAQSLLFMQCKVDRWRYDPTPAILQLFTTLLERPDLAEEVEVLRVGTESPYDIQFVPRLLMSLGVGPLTNSRFDARYSQALTMARDLLRQMLGFEAWLKDTEKNAYTTAICSILLLTPSLTELDMTVQLHAEESSDCIWEFFQRGLGQVKTLKTVHLHFNRMIGQKPFRVGMLSREELISFSRAALGLKALYFHPGLKQFNMHSFQRHDTAAIEFLMVMLRHSMEIWPTRQSDVQDLEFQHCELGANFLSDCISGSKELVRLTLAGSSVVVISPPADVGIAKVANALFEHSGNIHRLRLGGSNIKTTVHNAAGIPTGHRTEDMPYHPSPQPPLLDWKRLYGVKELWVTCNCACIYILCQHIPRGIEFLHVILKNHYLFLSSDISEARKELNDIVDELFKQGFKNLTMVHMRMYGQDFEFEKDGSSFKDVGFTSRLRL